MFPVAPPRSKCSCCGAPGRTIRGCSCKGGFSHQCLKVQPEPIAAFATLEQAGQKDVRGMAVAMRWRRMASKLVHKDPEEWDYLPLEQTELGQTTPTSKTDTMLDDSDLPTPDRKRGR